MKTKLLYHENSFMFESTATVVNIEGDEIALDATVFYPGGGGQLPDHGTISWQNSEQAGNVIALNKRNDVVWHTLDCSPPPVGAEVVCRIDWEFRYRMMRTHTALHILCAVVWRDHGAKVTGANMEPLRGRMDFEFEHLTGDLVREIEAAVNAEVEAARPTSVDFLAREVADRDPDLIRNKVSLLPPEIRVVRVVGIEGLDLQADGGTHVASTREVGRVEIPSYKSKGRINKRLEIALSEGE